MGSWDRTDGWLAKVLQDDHLLRFGSLIMGREWSDRFEMVTGITENGQVVVTSHPRDEYATDTFALRLPTGLIVAIGEAIKPGPGSDEVKRLEEALAVERKRVDSILEARR